MSLPIMIVALYVCHDRYYAAQAKSRTQRPAYKFE